jgi:peroxiredoxin Q/BCP
LGEIRDAWSDVESAGAVVYGVNPFSAGSHAKFARKIRLPYPLLVDQGGRIARQFGVGFWLIVRRSVFVIGPDGRIVWARLGQPPVEEILAAIPPA